MQLREQFWNACTRFPNCQWVLTSRVVGYDAVRFDHFGLDDVLPGLLDLDDVESASALAPAEVRKNFSAGVVPAYPAYLVPFNDAQINQFARNWYAEREEDEYRAQQGAEQFVADIHKHPTTHRLARTPNLLTMMVLIYRMRARLPNGRSMLYDEIADAYLQTIQEERRLELPPAPLSNMRSWLGYVAFQMQLRRLEESTQDEAREILAGQRQVQQWIVAAMESCGDPGNRNSPSNLSITWPAAAVCCYRGESTIKVRPSLRSCIFPFRNTSRPVISVK